MKQKWVRTYQELTVYQRSFGAAMSIYWLLPQLLVEEEDVLGQQLAEDSRSICTLLAEAWETRRYYKAFVAKLNEAEMKVAAVQTWLAFAMECGYLAADVGQAKCDLYRTVSDEISELTDEAADWSLGVAV